MYARPPRTSALADRAVLGQRSAGLPHEPHRRALDRLAPGGADEKRFHRGSRLTGRVQRTSRRPLRRASHRRPAGGPVDGARSRWRTRAPCAGGAALRLVPLARRPRQPDRLGRHPHRRAAARARRACHGRRRACARRSRPAATGSRSTWSPSSARGSPSSAARCSRRTSTSRRARASRTPTLPAGVEPAPDWAERVRAAHAEGYARRRRRDRLAGRAPAAAGRTSSRRTSRARAASRASRAAPLRRRCCRASSSSRSASVAGLPAFAAPRDEPWVYDGRIVLRRRR